MLWIALAICGIVYILTCFYIVQENTCVIVERCGKYLCTLSPGLNFLPYPFARIKKIKWTWKVEGPSKRAEWKEHSFVDISLGELIYDFAPAQVLTQDKIPVLVDGLVFYKIVDTNKAAYHADVGRALSLWIEGAIRSAVAQHKYEDIISESFRIQEEVFRLFSEEKTTVKSSTVAHNTWGIQLTSMSIQSISTAPEVKANLETLMRQRNTALAQMQISEIQCGQKLFESKATAQLECLRIKHELEMLRNKIEAEAANYKCLREVGMTEKHIASMKEIELLRGATRVIVPHNFQMVQQTLFNS